MLLPILLSFVTGVRPSPVQDQPGWPCAGTVDPAYVRGAEATGGKVMLFKRSEAARGAAAEVAASGVHDDIVLRAGGEVDAGQHDFDVPIDSTIQSVHFFVSLQCLEAASVVRPSGAELRADDPDVEHHTFDAVRLFTVKSPAPGAWKVRTAGSGLLSVIVTAKSDLALSGVTFSHGGAALAGAPTLGQDVRVEATVLGPARDVRFQFFSRSGTPIQPIGLVVEKEEGYGTTFAGDAVTPTERFRIGVAGLDERGYRFQRVHKWLVLGN